MYKKDIFGVRVDMGLNMQEAVSIIENLLKGAEVGHLVCTTNPEFIIDAQKDEEFKKIVNSSALSVPDGVGVSAADYYLSRTEKLESKNNLVSKIILPFKKFGLGMWTGLNVFGGKLSEKRISGVSLCEELFKLSAQKGYSIFLLGGWPRDWTGKRIEMIEDFAQKTARVIAQKYPGVNIIGATSKFSREEGDDEKTIEYIKSAMREKGVDTIDILLVAYNANKQERWVVRNAHKLPARVSIGVGGTFDYIVGHYKQVPAIFTKMGLDWFFRLITQPFRMKRIFNAFPIFPIKIFLFSLKHKNK